MNNSEQIKEHLRDLLTSQKLAVLSTHNQGQPYASLVAFVANEDLNELFFSTARTTRKYANLKTDPRAAMLIDSRSNQESDFHQAVAVTATGQTEEIEGEERNRLQNLYVSKHPYLEEFLNSPSCALMRLKVDCFYMVSRFQKVMELHVT
jgi:nitroimidazol reductase NimA-like FMN-containing flavoprotein (pyridoxamine 5'-phosphate oxidase superfamily)